MKKIFALVLAVVFVLALFAACGNTPSTPTTPDTPSNPSTPDTPSNPSTPDTPDTPATPEGPFAVDDKGIAKEPYEWPLPLTDDSDTVLTYWWSTYSPQYIPADKEYQDTDLPQEILKRTGVNVEWQNIPNGSRQEMFGVLLASDDLSDMMHYATAYYPGTPLQMVEDGYFVNVLDHKDCMPNYLYQSKWKDPSDKATYESVFYEDDLVPVIWSLWKEPIQTDTGWGVRADMLAKIGKKPSDLNTWDDFYEALKGIKSAIDTVEFPMWMSSMIETNHYWQFNSFENVSVITTIALPIIYYRDGELVMGCTSEGDRQFAEYMSKLFGEKLVNPDWQTYFFASFQAQTYANETFYQGISPNYKDTNEKTDDPNCDWQPVHKPLVTADQVVHAGTVRSRTSTGNICVAAKNHDVELCLKWIDYRFDPTGWELFAYGPEGKVIYKDADGVRHNTDWALSKPDGMELSALMSVYTTSRLTECLLAVTDAQYLGENGHFAMEAIEYWTNFDKEHYDRAGALPMGVRLSTEQSEEVGKYRADLITYVAEKFSGFVDGSTPLSEWDNYQKTLDQMGRQEVLKIYAEAVEDYNAKQG